MLMRRFAVSLVDSFCQAAVAAEWRDSEVEEKLVEAAVDGRNMQHKTESDARGDELEPGAVYRAVSKSLRK